jgi:hypothetical protein
MGPTLGDRLKAMVGSEYDELWLAQALGCPAATATELQGYLIPQGPPHLVEQTLGIFAKVLDLDAQRLFNLVGGGSLPPRSAAAQVPVRRNIPQRQAKPETRVSTAPQRPSAPPPPPQAEISIGSAEGVRVVKQQQPTIVYRKTRRYAGQA